MKIKLSVYRYGTMGPTNVRYTNASNEAMAIMKACNLLKEQKLADYVEISNRTRTPKPVISNTPYLTSIEVDRKSVVFSYSDRKMANIPHPDWILDAYDWKAEE